MVDSWTIFTAVWPAILTLIIAEFFKQVPYSRIRILLPLVCGVIPGLSIIIAAIAIRNDEPLVTRDRHFPAFNGLEIIQY